MSMYLSNEDIGPTGWEASEFIDPPFNLEPLAAEAETDLDEASSS